MGGASEGNAQVVLLPLNQITALSAVRIFIHKDLRPQENCDHGVQASFGAVKPLICDQNQLPECLFGLNSAITSRMDPVRNTNLLTATLNTVLGTGASRHTHPVPAELDQQQQIVSSHAPWFPRILADVFLQSDSCECEDTLYGRPR